MMKNYNNIIYSLKFLGINYSKEIVQFITVFTLFLYLFLCLQRHPTRTPSRFVYCLNIVCCRNGNEAILVISSIEYSIRLLKFLHARKQSPLPLARERARDQKNTFPSFNRKYTINLKCILICRHLHKIRNIFIYIFLLKMRIGFIPFGALLMMCFFSCMLFFVIHFRSLKYLLTIIRIFLNVYLCAN